MRRLDRINAVKVSMTAIRLLFPLAIALALAGQAYSAAAESAGGDFPR